jgi:hypothetical protein
LTRLLGARRGGSLVDGSGARSAIPATLQLDQQPL